MARSRWFATPTGSSLTGFRGEPVLRQTRSLLPRDEPGSSLAGTTGASDGGASAGAGSGVGVGVGSGVGSGRGWVSGLGWRRVRGRGVGVVGLATGWRGRGCRRRWRGGLLLPQVLAQRELARADLRGHVAAHSGSATVRMRSTSRRTCPSGTHDEAVLPGVGLQPGAGLGRGPVAVVPGRRPAIAPEVERSRAGARCARARAP